MRLGCGSRAVVAGRLAVSRLAPVRRVRSLSRWVGGKKIQKSGKFFPPRHGPFCNAAKRCDSRDHQCSRYRMFLRSRRPRTKCRWWCAPLMRDARRRSSVLATDAREACRDQVCGWLLSFDGGGVFSLGERLRAVANSPRTPSARRSAESSRLISKTLRGKHLRQSAAPQSSAAKHADRRVGRRHAIGR